MVAHATTPMTVQHDVHMDQLGYGHMYIYKQIYKSVACKFQMTASGMTTNTITKAYKLMFISYVTALITKFPTHVFSYITQILHPQGP